jgi:hypothetical protein
MSDEAPPQSQAQPQLQAPQQRYIFSGHALGAGAQFHELNDQKCNYVVPVLGASVIPPTGGLSESCVSDYRFDVAYPCKRNLLTVRRIKTKAEGRDFGTYFETTTDAEITSLTIVDKLHIDFVKVHVVSRRDPNQPEPLITSTGNEIEGFRLGRVTATIKLDNDALRCCATRSQLTQYFQTQGAKDRGLAKLAEKNGVPRFTIAREVGLQGPETDKHKIQVIDNNTIHWDGFGWMFFGEVIVRDQDRQVTLVRLQMGSDAAGSGNVGDGRSNGQLPGG